MKAEEYLEAILALPDMQDLLPKVSPDGRWVAWVWFGLGPAADVYVAPTDGSAAPIRLTDTDEDTYLVAWLPDSSGVLVEQDRSGNERVQIFRVDLGKPLVMTPLTEPDPNYYIRGAQMHPNGRWLVYGANVDVETEKEIEPTWVYRRDLISGERLPLARPEKGGYMLLDLNHPGTHILYSRQDLHPAGRQIWLVDIEGQQDREILNFGSDVKTFVSWFPDGQRVLVMAETETHRRVGIWRLEDQSLLWLIDDPARDIEDVFVPHRSENIVIVESVRGRTRCTMYDLESDTETRLPNIAGNLIPLAPVDGQWVGFYYGSRQPTEAVLFRLDENLDPEKFKGLSRVWERTALRIDDYTQAEDFDWRSTDDLMIHGWLYRPQGDARGTIVYVHGGPTWHSQDWINTKIQFFVNQGFNILDPNYRGSTGYGLPFREAIKVHGWGGMEQEDIRAGIQALFAAGIAEPGKVGVTGTSYGGYSSWYAITKFPPELVAAAAPICGMTDLEVDYETTRPDLRPFSAEMMGGSPAEVPQRYYERSPIHFIQDIRGSLLIVQGAQDPNVTPENVRVVEIALNKAEIPYQKLVFEDEGHGISKKANQKTLCLRLLAFFEEAFVS